MSLLEMPTATPSGSIPPRTPPPRHVARIVIATWVIGLLTTLAATAYLVRIPPVYSTQVSVLFIAPLSRANPNGLQITPSSLVATAGVVAQLVNRSDATTRVVSENVTLSGQGIRRGSSVTLPNSGGQWSNVYSQAELDVQVVGSNRSIVIAETDRLTSEINDALSAAQQQQHVAPVNLIRTQLSPPNPTVIVQAGSKSRAGLATLLLGCGLTATLATALRRRGLRRRGA